MLNRDLAELYEVETRILKRNVRRHIKRFPADFMFEHSYPEIKSLTSQFGMSNRGGIRYRTMAFTEQGVAMLSRFLISDRAFGVNIDDIFLPWHLDLIVPPVRPLRWMVDHAGTNHIQVDIYQTPQQMHSGFDGGCMVAVLFKFQQELAFVKSLGDLPR